MVALIAKHYMTGEALAKVGQLLDGSAKSGRSETVSDLKQLL